jgi:hypothetical protein
LFEKKKPGETGVKWGDSMKNNCAGMEAKLASLLLDPASAPAGVAAHVESCVGCRRELEELRATMALLESWEGPEPNPYFLTRLEARMREERAAGAAGWFALLRARLLYESETHVRPLAAMALTFMLLVGGGAYLGVTNWNQPPAIPETAVVHDLQTLDSNAQLLDQLETLSNNNEN